MTHSIYRIGIFDSGLGGLSVQAALKHRLPHASLLYVADSGFAPYGTKTPDEVLARSRYIADFLMQQQIDALVIACNTATAAAAKALRASIGVPVIAMEPGLKPAIAASQNGQIAVLATRGTLASQQFSQLRHRYADHIDLAEVPCAGWVTLVENGKAETAEADQLIADTLATVKQAGVDTLVLGCTHFPFLRAAIQKAMPDATLIETADAVAAQVERRLPAAPAFDLPQANRYWSSGDLAKAALVKQLCGEKIELESLPSPADKEGIRLQAAPEK